MLNLVLGRLSINDLIGFRRLIKVKTMNGDELPFTAFNVKSNIDWQAPKHPLESNTYLSDTIWREPITLDLEGQVPIKQWDNFYNLINGAWDSSKKDNNSITAYLKNVGNALFGTSNKTTISGVQGGNSYVLYEITCLGNTYTNMALLGLEKSETADNSTSFAVSLSFQQIRTATAEYAEFSKGNVKNTGSADMSNKGMEQVGDEMKKGERQQSRLYKIFE